MLDIAVGCFTKIYQLSVEDNKSRGEGVIEARVAPKAAKVHTGAKKVKSMMSDILV